MATTELFDLVPTDLLANLEFRHKLWSRAHGDLSFQADMMKACKEDFLFWSAAFAWVYEPRPRPLANGGFRPTTVPFIPWPHQIPVILNIRHNIGRRDVVVKKSRGEGMSWIGILMALHDWLFFSGRKIGLVSRTELMADDPGNMDSLLAKCLSVKTNVLRPSGSWMMLEHLEVGDQVVGSDGLPVNVIGKVAPYEADLFDVVFGDGTSIACTGDHKFPVTEKYQRQSARRLYNPHKPSNVAVQDMLGRLKCSDGKHWNFMVQAAPCVEFPEQLLAIEPYTLGVLLGDGCLSKCATEFACVDVEIAERVNRHHAVKKWGGICWGISGLKPKLRSLGLDGKRAWEKSIPAPYLRASKRQRLELLRGLMDTDGTVANRSGYATFTTTSKVMARQVQVLVRSLGGASYTRNMTNSYKYKGEAKQGRRSWMVSVSLPQDNPFHLQRKAEKYRFRRHTTGKLIVDIKPAGRGMVSCISVDSPDRLFIAQDYTLTHNCDWELERLPKWMTGYDEIDWKRDKNRHSFVNFRTGSQINAFAATSDTGRAGRYTWFMPDELGFWDRPKDQKFMDSIRSSTDSRLIISTPNGMDGAYYKIAEVHPGNALVMVLSWRDNPDKNRGLYKVINDKPYLVDPVANPFPTLQPGWRLPDAAMFNELRKKGFKIEGTIRSPWYDYECLKSDATPRSIATELDIDFGGSMHKYFFPDFFRKLDGEGQAEGTIRPPMWRGRFDWLKEELKGVMVSEEDGKELKLWCPLDKGRVIAGHSYVFGIDISRGEGGDFTSNSVCSIIDLNTMEQVGEWATNTVEPIPFADGCIALAKIFNNAYMIWEHNGPGNSFGRRVLERRYGNIHYRTDDFQRIKSFGGVKKVGWVSGGGKKATLMDGFRRAVIVGELTVRSADVAKECNEYIIEPATGKVRHLLAGRSDDDPDQGEAHGDRVIAIALALEGAKERPVAPAKKITPDQVVVDERSFGGRMQIAKEKQEAEEDEWEGSTTYASIRLGTYSAEGAW